MSFRLKTILGIALVQAILLFVLVGSSLHYLESSNDEELRKRAYTEASLFGSTTENAVLALDLASLESAVREMLTNPGIVYARVRDGDGRVLAEGGRAEALQASFNPDLDLEHTTDGVFDAVAEITEGGQVYGRVEIGLGTEVIKETLAKARRNTIAIALAGSTLVLLFSYLLGTYLTGLLATLKTAAQRIATGEMGYRVDVKGNDELADTARAFNEMSRKLKAMYEERAQAERALSEANEGLERRVQERTEQLAQAYRRIEHQALYDSLTALPNRALFQQRLHAACSATGQPFGLVIVDLNGFKELNDSFGHPAGDAALQEIAARMRQAFDVSVTIARLGGDEFALLLPGVADEGAACAALERLGAVFEAPVVVDGQAVPLGASLGLARYPDDGREARLLLRRADTAMYDAKRRKADYMIYAAELERGLEPAGLQTEMRRAIGQPEFLVHYQPVVETATGAFVGVEALVRWDHPQHGLLLPDDFIPLAERTGLVRPLATWVLSEALRQAKAWERQGLKLSVSVNVAIGHLQDPALPDTVAQALALADMPASQLAIEITESGIMSDPRRTTEVVRRLHALGTQLVIDDFGTGYSSMAHLKRLPISTIKLDKSFVREMHASASDEAIVRSVIGLGHSLGLRVVAEGVEDERTWQRLGVFGCDLGQGYWLSRPLPAAQIAPWARDRKNGLQPRLRRIAGLPNRAEGRTI